MGKHIVNKIPVAVYDRVTGKLVTTYSTASVAARRMGIKYSSYIVRSCRKNPAHLSVYGYIFRFIENPNIDPPEFIDVSDLPPIRNQVGVAKLDAQGNVIEIYESINLAADRNFISPSGLTMYLRHGIATQSIKNKNQSWRLATREDVIKYGQTRSSD